MWQEKDALTLAETYFRKDEKYLFAEVMPWYYCFSLPFLLIIFGYGILASIIFLFWTDIPPIGTISTVLPGICILYYAGTRSMYPNYMIISQKAVYRFILKSIRQFDEIPLSKIGKITIHSIPTSKKCAVLTLSCTHEYVQSRPERKRKYEIRHAQQNPEKVNPRFLASRKPTRLRFVVKKPWEYETVFKELQEVMDYHYSLSVKGKETWKKN